MQNPPPFPTFQLNDAPHAASLNELVAGAAERDQTFELYPSKTIDAGLQRFADLWHLNQPYPDRQQFGPGPLTTAAVSVRSIAGALIHPGSGFVFDREGRVLWDSATAEHFRDRTWARSAPLVAAGVRYAREMAAQTRRSRQTTPVLLANHGGYTVFGHLMCETIPIALIFSRWLRAGRMKLLMPPAQSTGMADRLLDLTGLAASVQTRSNQPFMWTQSLIVSSVCSAAATFRPGPMLHDLARTIKATVPIPTSGPRRRLFLTRAGERTTQRRDLVNEDALIAALRPLGFEAVNPGLLPPRGQVALFGQAECLVAMMGSVWANLIYARRDTLVVDLLPEHKAAIGDTFGINMAKAMSLPYILILTKSEGPGAGQLDVTADVPLVVDRIARGLERVKQSPPSQRST